MGEAMTTNMLSAGLNVKVWNRTSSKCDPIKALGASVGATSKEIFDQSDVIFVMLSTPAAAMEFWTENAKHAKGKIVVDCATLGADCMATIGEKVSAAGGKFLEAPVAGHSGMAKAKTIEFLVAGPKDVFETVGPALDTMAKGRNYCGEKIGDGSKMKLVVNSTLGNMMASLAEALVLTEKAGLKPQQYIDIINSHAALSSGLFKMFGPKMLAGDHAPLFMTKHEAKDLGLALEMAKKIWRRGANCSSHVTVEPRHHGGRAW
jgi:3-hydroxyisobutyrate dehydrogenase-like beta-hydroxyacid dehydrogenase